MQRVLALVLATVSAGCMAAAIAGMASGRFGGLPGAVLRATAVVCFAGAVALGTVSC